MDASGTILGELPEQTPYLEWENSVYGNGVEEDRICQDCHMPHGGQLTPRSPFAQHHFVGGNTFMLKILQGRMEELALTSSSDHFAATIGRTMNQLQSNTAEVTILEATIQEDSVKILVNIENTAGHKFPTGFPSRRAWVHLVLKDSTGQILFESGKPLPDGSLMGDDADVDFLTCEPHYDVISRPDQVQIYQSVMQNSDGEVAYTLLRGASYVKDNRLLLEGFDKSKVMEHVAVYGAAVNDENFTGGSDLVQYVIDLEGASGPFTVTGELLYQSISSSFMQDLSADSTKLVDRFIGFYNDADRSPVVIAMVEKTVE